MGFTNYRHFVWSVESIRLNVGIRGIFRPRTLLEISATNLHSANVSRTNAHFNIFSNKTAVWNFHERTYLCVRLPHSLLRVRRTFGLAAHAPLLSCFRRTRVVFDNRYRRNDLVFFLRNHSIFHEYV